MITLTSEQEAIVRAQVNPGEALKIIAYAGTGKTSTFVEYAFDHSERMLYLAFNKSVETEAKQKFGPNVKAKTVHALAYAAVGRKFRNIGQLRYYSVMKMLDSDVYPATLVCMTLENYFNSDDEEMSEKHVAEDVLQRYRMGYKDRVLEAARSVWKYMQAERDPFQMSHSGYLKLFQLEKPLLGVPTILLDEAQDTNPVTFDIVRRQMANGSRVLFSGDPHQQIYSWRGAVDAMSMISAPTLFLTKSFRFGPRIANVANTILKTFFSIQKPLIGQKSIDDHIVKDIPAGEKYTVICRTNVEVFKQALQCALKNPPVPIFMGGGESFNQFLEAITDVYLLYVGRRNEIKSRQIAFFKDFESLCRFSEDRLDAELMARVKIVDFYGTQIPAHIESIRKAVTAARHAQVTIITAHKAKGLEWDNVMLANDFASLYDDQNDGSLLPVSTGNADEDKKLGYKRTINRDEINLIYVAATRAKRRLKLNQDLGVLVGEGKAYCVSA